MTGKRAPRRYSTDARRTALELLERIENQGAYSTLVLRRALDSGTFSAVDSRLLSHLVYGVLKRRNTLDWVVARHRHRGGRIRPVVRNLLRLGAYQLLFMNSIPPYAACDTTVALARRVTRHPSEVKFVNALMRKIASRPDLCLPPESADVAAHIALAHAHPRWLVQRWLERIGRDDTRRLCEANNRTPSVTLRVNTRAISRPDFMRELEKMTISCRPGKLAPDAVKISRRSLSGMANVPRHCFTVQDEASILVGHLLRPEPEERILDLCAGLGTKSMHILELTRGQAEVTAVDIHRFKLDKLAARSRQCRFPEPALLCRDACLATLPDEIGVFHRVLVDAPCTGLGTVRHKPELKWRASLEKIAGLHRLQLRLLSTAARCLAPGGVLMYTTCSTEPEENHEVVADFLDSHPGFRQLVPPGLTSLPLEPETGSKSLSLYPHTHGTDGFFVAAFTTQ